MKYRREIDGLRALAVLPVILFHAGFPTFSGGYVGVDIFFVISGYLITTLILDEMDKGSFSLIKFYDRRARRILPALFFVMLCTLPFAWSWMLPLDLKGYFESLVAIPLFSSNFLFYLKSGYYDKASELQPFLHTWSLAVEEQYYVIFPLFLMLAWKLGKNRIFQLLFVTTIISLFIAQWGKLTYSSFSFYLLPARAFEILIGALIALQTNYKSFVNAIGQPVNQSVSIIGLLLIFYAIFSFDKNTPYPSFYTLIPTLGAGFILVFGNSRTLVGKLLGSKVLVGIGLISYSAYLWHQPLFAFARLRIIGHLSSIELIFICLSSLILGYITWYYVEQPFRNSKIISRKKFIGYSLLITFFYITVGLIGYLAKGFPNRFHIPNDVAKTIVGNDIRKNCDLNYDNKGTNINFCDLGDKNQEKIDMAIIGDSHSMSALSAFDNIGREISKRYTHIGLGGCPPLIDVDVGNGNYGLKICENLANRQFEFVKYNNINKVFLIGKWSLYTDGGYDGFGMYYLITENNSNLDKASSRINFKKSIRNTIEKYQSIGVQVFVMTQIPEQKISAELLYPQLYLTNNSNKDQIIKSLSITMSEHLLLQKYNRNEFESLNKLLNFNLVNLDYLFCDGKRCYIGDATRSYYRDYCHISNYGALHISEAIKKKIENH
jgi:peptidoglycan/LPS O-acetylase OafA/YrhL